MYFELESTYAYQLGRYDSLSRMSLCWDGGRRTLPARSTNLYVVVVLHSLEKAAHANTMEASRVFSCLILLLLSACWWCDQHFIIPLAVVPKFVSVTGFQVATPTSSNCIKKKRSRDSSGSNTSTNSFQLQPRGSHRGERLLNNENGVAVLLPVALSAVAGAGLPTELPDSLDDAAQIAARCCRDLVQMSGRTRCRVDIDTSAGDETYTLLKSSTQFMQKFTSALCYSMIPGLAPHRQDQLNSLIQAKAELNKLLLEENNTDEELSTNSSDNSKKERIEQLQRVGPLIMHYILVSLITLSYFLKLFFFPNFLFFFVRLLLMVEYSNLGRVISFESFFQMVSFIPIVNGTN
jgi:hypothetical protein